MSSSLYTGRPRPHPFAFFFFNDTATTEIYTLSLHDALPILHGPRLCTDSKHQDRKFTVMRQVFHECECVEQDRKSTRLNSSHGYISYAVFCLKKKTSHRHNSLAVFTF